jgi:hypothetical protein
MKCAKCGKKMSGQGGQWTCMNDACEEYLVGKSAKKESALVSELSKGKA